MLCYLAGMETYYLKGIKDGPFQPKIVEGDDKPESQWTLNERRVVVQDQCLKSIIIFEGTLDTKENMIKDLKLEYQTFRSKPTKTLSQTYTRYKTLHNELANDGVNLSKYEINVDIYGSNVIQDFQENSDDEVDERSSEEYLKDLDIEFHERSLLENSKCFIKRRNNFSSQKANENTKCYKYGKKADPKIQKDYKAEYKKMKAKLALIEANPSTSQTLKSFYPKNKGLVAETFDWDEEEVLDDEEVTQVKVLMALADDELTVGKNHACNGEWIDITMRKVNILLSMDEDADWILYCMICKKEDHRTSDHEMYTTSLKRSKNYNAQPYQYASLSKQILKVKAKPFPPCTHRSFNEHRPDDYRNYPECEICGSYDHFTLGHNRVIHIRGGVLAESSKSSKSSIGVKCNTYG
ncbi:hypothetical protein Tco_0475214 [Tanacetum coccineum]